jgi:glucokinase
VRHAAIQGKPGLKGDDMTEPSLLIGDIGGTNARFALAHPADAGFTEELTLSCADFETADEAIAAYLARAGASEPDVICLACAGPVLDGRVNVINNHWEIDSRDLVRRYPMVSVRLLNDFEAIAYSIPLLTEADLMSIGVAPVALQENADFTIAVIGPGTGLGIGGLLSRGGGFYPVVGEGGHAGFAPQAPAQQQVLRQLRKDFERVSNERLISGPGLENIYRALSSERGKPETITAAEIFSRVLARQDAVASDAVQLFFEALGQVAGDLVLTLGAYDGVFLAGGILKRYPDLLKASDFRAGFEAKGRHRGIMERVPISLVLHPQPGLLGAGLCARTAAVAHT